MRIHSGSELIVERSRHLPPDVLGRMARLVEKQGQTEAERFLQESERLRPGRLPRERGQVLIRTGVAGDQIAHWAQARGADLVVMGTHGWSGLLRWMLGSVAHHVIQVAPCPVLTVGPAGQARSPVIRAEAVAENALSVELIRQHLSTSTVGRPLTA